MAAEHPVKIKRRGSTKRNVGLAACLLVAAYLLLSPAYALLNFREYASQFPHLMRYVVIPGLVGIAFVAIGLFAKARFALMAGICGVSVLTALFLFEALLAVQSVPVRLTMLGQLDNEQAETLNQNKTMVRGYTLDRLNRMAGTDTLPAAQLSGFPKTQVILCTPKNDIISYTADRYGFNNPDGIFDRRVDMALLGDSFAEGFCLPPGDDLASRLRDGGIATASMGIRGSGPLTELATLGRFGSLLRPRHVLMAFFEGNDWENLEEELKAPWLRSAIAPNADYGSQATAQETISRNRAAMALESRKRVTMVDLLLRTQALRNFFALQETFGKLGLFYPKIAQDIPEFRQILRRAKTLTESWGGTFTLLYIPRVDRFLATFPSDQVFDQLRTMVLDAAAAEGVDVIDLSPELRNHPEPMRMYAPDSHFSRNGTVFAADIILRQLAAIDAKSGKAAATK